MSTENWLAFAGQLTLMVGFPVALAIVFGRRFHLPARIFFLAAGFYLLNLVAQAPFLFLWQSQFGKLPWAALALTTLTYGMCEETMRYFSFRAGRVMRANRTANGALLAGVGHGGAEAILFALGGVAGVVAALVAPQTLGPTNVASILNGPWWMFLAMGASRILAITAHLGFATLIVLAYRRSWLFFPLAIFMHVLVDFSTFGLQIWSGSLWWTFALFTAWALLALGLLLWARKTTLMTPPAPAVVAEEATQLVSA